MKKLKFVPDHTEFQFVKWWKPAVIMSFVVMIGALVLLFTKGLEFGIDFQGGTAIEITTQGPADIGGLRSRLNNLNIGEVQIQRLGEDNNVLIRVGSQGHGESKENEGQAAVEKIKAELGDSVEYRRVETVGPQVSGELIRSAVIAVLISVILMAIYIWFRFEWQFGIGAVLSIAHDVLATVGLFILLGYEFNLTSIAALLTIAGYSMNDTVVVFDRIRENLRKYKKMELGQLIDLALNETLSRTIMTSVTTLLALVALFVFGGEVIRSFTFAMIFGIVIGTYSSIYVAGPVLLAIGVTRDWSGNTKAEAAQAESAQEKG